jgi:hypothetical protein
MQTRALMTPAETPGVKRLMILCDLDPAFYALGVEEQSRLLDEALMVSRERVVQHLDRTRAGHGDLVPA